MKSILILFLFFIAIAGGVLVGSNIHNQSHTFALRETNTPTPTPQKVVEIPQTISIPSIQLHTIIEPVGVDNKGKMDVPKKVEDTGWFDLGYRPGQNGNAVIDGHLDTVTGAPAAFWNIAKLHPGDRIIITDVQNQEYSFTITRVTAYPYNNFPLQEIFGPSNIPKLNLITCAGVWDKVNHNYSMRTVVYAQME